MFLAATLLLWNSSCLSFSPLIFLFLQFISFESSLFFTPYELEIESIFERPPARLWSFTGVRLFLRFQFVRSVKLLRVGAGIRSCALPKECRAFFPKTTVSWHTTKVRLHKDIVILLNNLKSGLFEDRIANGPVCDLDVFG